MRIANVLSDKSIKRMDARTMIVDGIVNGSFTMEGIESAS